MHAPAPFPWGQPQGRPTTVRGHNLGLALRCIAQGSGLVSRADISARTGLNRSTSSSLVDELIAGGLVREVGVTARTGVGRPPTGLALATDGPAGFGIELNVDYVAACVVDLTGTVRYRHVSSEDHRGRPPEDVLARVAFLVDTAVQSVTTSGLVPYGAAIAVPGLVNAASGMVTLAPNLGWEEFDPTAGLEPHAFGPDVGLDDVVIDNEANFAALSERSLLAAGESFLYVYGEIGVGSGLVLGGELYRGRHGWSGEIGHVTVDRDGPTCACGGRGCLEQYAGHEAILRTAGVGAVAGTPLGVGPTANLIGKLARAGDSAMLAALDRAGSAIGLVVSGSVNLLDIGHIVLGGIYRELAPWLIPAIQREVAVHVTGARWAAPCIGAATYGAEAPSFGAALSVVRRLLQDPTPWLMARAAS